MTDPRSPEQKDKDDAAKSDDQTPERAEEKGTEEPLIGDRSEQNPEQPSDPDAAAESDTDEVGGSETVKNEESANTASQTTPDAEKSTPADTGPAAGHESASAKAASGAANKRESAPESRSGRSAGAAAALVISVIALLGLIAGGIWVWQSLDGLRQSQMQQQDLQEQLQQNAATLEDVQAELGRVAERRRGGEQALRQEITQLQSEVQRQLTRTEEQFQQRFEQVQERLNGHRQRLLNLSTTNREDWLLAEAEYLLRLANQRVLIERSPQNAVALLQSADEILKRAADGLGDPELIAVRSTLAEEITALKMVASVDRDGIYAQLQGLSRRLDDLPSVPESGLQSASRESQSSQPPADSWPQRAWQELKSMAGVFSQYVRIQDADAPAQPLADQATLQWARMNIRLLLEQAQVALLKEDGTIYRQSLEEARALLSRHFRASPEREEYQATLETLQQEEVAPDIPDITESIQLLHGYIAELHRTRPQNRESTP